jgi:hypothetical protein
MTKNVNAPPADGLVDTWNTAIPEDCWPTVRTFRKRVHVYIEWQMAAEGCVARQIWAAVDSFFVKALYTPRRARNPGNPFPGPSRDGVGAVPGVDPKLQLVDLAAKYRLFE